MCEGCTAGNYSDKNGAVSCLSCLAGSFSSGNATMCNLCSPGHFAAQNGILILKLKLLFSYFIDSYVMKMIDYSENVKNF